MGRAPSPPRSTAVSGGVDSSYAERPLLDVASASVRLGCSERFIRRLVQERRIPFVKLGGTKVRFVGTDLDRWVASQRVEARR